MGKKIDILGEKFGRLTVIKENGRNKHNQMLYECECICGKKVLVLSYDLRHGVVKSCGCLKRDRGYNLAKEYRLKHGRTGTRLYKIWHGMKTRCKNVNSKFYKYYGARGISVCDEWDRNFKNFYEWAIKNGYDENLTLDRIDNNGNYEPSNCKWSTRQVQMNNRCSTLFLTYDNKTKALTEWAREYNMRPVTLRQRIYSGWSVERAITTPVQTKKNQK